MFSTWVKSLGVVGVVGLLSAVSAEARTVNLTDSSGASLGWTATIPDVGDDASVNLTFIRSANGVAYFNKSATITNNNQPVIIEFDRTSASASTLAIGTESIKNSSGADWTGFRTFLSTASATSNGTGTGFSFAFTGGSGRGDFSIDPFTTFTFTNNATEMDVSGGTVANGATWTPGSTSTSGTGLAIMSGTSGADRFLLKEMSLTGGTGPGPVPIPLPAAAWTGLSTLLGLGVLGSLKRVRRAL